MNSLSIFCKTSYVFSIHLLEDSVAVALSVPELCCYVRKSCIISQNCDFSKQP